MICGTVVVHSADSVRHIASINTPDSHVNPYVQAFAPREEERVPSHSYTYNLSGTRGGPRSEQAASFSRESYKLLFLHGDQSELQMMNVVKAEGSQIWHD